ncbi:hypothetical protein JHK87_007734 [Glycine soja]|nr:hypothetical protein JHK87_007734 [Glycine soja]
MLPSYSTGTSFFKATSLLQQPAEKLFEELTPLPSCIVSECLPYATQIVKKINVLRVSFVGVIYFCLLCMHNITTHTVRESITSESECFVLPGIPDKIEITIAQAGQPMNESWKRLMKNLGKLKCLVTGGWNSTLEAICAGVPMLTRPLFADQFLNEILVVHVLKVGVEIPLTWDKKVEIGVQLKKEDAERAIVKLMYETSESEERRKRVKELAEMAKRAVEKAGSSHSNMTLLIEEIMQKTKRDV